LKQRRFTQNTPFHLKEMAQKTCQNPTQSSICNLFNQVLKCNFDFKYQFNCIPAKFNCRPWSWPSFSHWSLVSNLCNWTLNWL
jgi:hypothetical protein